jgi:hypothetical protein
MNFKGNICIKERFGGRVYLYTHKRGLETFAILRAALTRGKSKWTDEQYLSRVIFCDLVNGTDLDKTGDFGISSFLGDNELPIFVLDIVNQRVMLEEGRCLATCPCVGQVWTFKEFTMLTEDPRIAYLQKVLNGES